MNYPKKEYTCDKVRVSHVELCTLRDAGHLNLGISNDVAAKISNDGFGPSKGSANAAFYFWNFVAFGVFGYTVFLSFTSAWWWFIPGLIGIRMIWKANKQGNSDNLLDAAFYDEAFYERVREMGGWIYQIDERGINALNISQANNTA